MGGAKRPHGAPEQAEGGQDASAGAAAAAQVRHTPELWTSWSSRTRPTRRSRSSRSSPAGGCPAGCRSRACTRHSGPPSRSPAGPQVTSRTGVTGVTGVTGSDLRGLRAHLAGAGAARVCVGAAGRVALTADTLGKAPVSKRTGVTPPTCEALLTHTLACAHARTHTHTHTPITASSSRATPRRPP